MILICSLFYLYLYVFMLLRAYSVNILLYLATESFAHRPVPGLCPSTPLVIILSPSSAYFQTVATVTPFIVNRSTWTW